MKVLAKYISGIFTKNFFLSVLSLSVLFLFQAILGQLLNHEFLPEQVFIYNFLGFPQDFVQMTPPAVLMGTVLTLSTLSRSNELIACYSIGIGLRQIMTVIVSLVFMISCFVLVLQDRVLPPIYKKQTTYFWREMKQRQDFYMDIKQDKIWYRSKNLIYNIRTFDKQSNTIHGMAVYTFDENFNLVEVIDANKAQYLFPKGWKLMDGTVTIFPGQEEFPMTTRFKEKSLQIGETPKDFREIEKEVDGLRLKDLLKYIRRVKQSGTDTKSYEVKFHAKISLSFIPLVMCFLAVPFSTRTRREGGLALDLSICLGVTFCYWLFYSIGLSLGSNGSLVPWVAAWLPSAVFGSLAGFLIYRRWR